MQFGDIINAKHSKESDRPLMQKDPVTVSDRLQQYLSQNGRSTELPISYSDLVYYSHSNALRDKEGKLTHWETAIFEEADKVKLDAALVQTFALLKKSADPHFSRNIAVQQIDFCEFGNSVPFRVNIRFKDSGLSEQYYIKMADASRIYGLELEGLVAPASTNFLADRQTLIESNIPGVPGDIFLKDYLHLPGTDQQMVAKQFVRFNERCFARLLGDMRSYNFVVDVSGNSYAMRPIDFDQQCYEGRKNLYMPQFYKENHTFVDLVLRFFTPAEIIQLQEEERETMRTKIRQNLPRMLELLHCMQPEELSENYKIKILRRELNDHFKTMAFAGCNTMGELVACQLKQLLGKWILDAGDN